MSSLISYLHCSPTRPVNSMVGISVGFHNVYSMLTGHCRLDKITLHKIQISHKYFGFGFWCQNLVRSAQLWALPRPQLTLGYNAAFLGLEYNFLFTDKSSRCGRGWWRWRRRIWSRGSGLSRGNLVVLDPEEAAGNPVRVPWQFLERNLKNLTWEESSGRIWFDFKEEKTSGRWFSTTQKISRRKG